MPVQLPRAVGFAPALVVAGLMSCSDRDRKAGSGGAAAGDDRGLLNAAMVTGDLGSFEPWQRFAEIQSLPEARRAAQLSRMYFLWGRESGLEAVLHAERLGTEVASSSLSDAFRGWLASDPHAAWRWVDGLDEGRRRVKFAHELAAAQPDIGGRVALADQFAGTVTGERLRSRLIREFALEDPAAGLRWILDGGAERGGAAAAGELVRAWAEEDAFAASQAVFDMPAGEFRDRAAAALAVVIAHEQPAAATRWAETIADPLGRERTLRSIKLSSSVPVIMSPVAAGEGLAP